MAIITKEHAVRDAAHGHNRAVDAAIVNVDNHLIRYHGEPIEVDARFGAVHVNKEIVAEVIRVYSAGSDGYGPGWTVTEQSHHGKPVLRFE